MLLEGFRTHKRWLMFISTVLIVPSFVVTGIYSYNRMISDDGAIATVDGKSVLPQQFDEAKRKQLDNLQARLGEDFRANMLDNQEAKHLLLQNVLTDVSLGNEAELENVVISDGTVIEMIKTFPAFQENGKFSQVRYENYLSSTGQSDQYFVHTIRNDVMRQLLTNGIARQSLVPKSVITHINQALTENRTAKLFDIEAAKYLKDVTVTDADTKEYWTKNQKTFELPDEADVQYVVLSPETFTGNVPGEDEIRSFYEQNPNRFKEPETRRARHLLINLDKGDEAAKKLADDLYAQIKADPKKFESLAKQYSNDPGSARVGGDLGYFEQGQMVDEFDKAVFGGKKGDIVGLVKTQFGYHIVEILDVKQAHIKPLAEVRDEIIELYDEQQSQKKFAEEAENFTNTAYEQSDSLQPLIEKYNLKPVTVNSVLSTGSNDPSQKQYLNGSVVEALFADECLKEKRNTQAIEVAQNTLVVARVTSYRPAHVQPYETVKEQIKDMLMHDRALEKATEQGKAIVADLKAGKASGVTFGKEVTMSRAKPAGNSYDLIGAVLRVPAGNLPAYVGVVNGDRYTIAQVLKSEIPAAAEKQTEGMRAELGKLLGRAEESAYFSALKAKHKATITNKDYLPEAMKD